MQDEPTRGLMRQSYRIARWSHGMRKWVPSPDGCRASDPRWSARGASFGQGAAWTHDVLDTGESVEHDGPVPSGHIVEGRVDGRDSDRDGHWEQESESQRWTAGSSVSALFHVPSPARAKGSRRGGGLTDELAGEGCESVHGCAIGLEKGMREVVGVGRARSGGALELGQRGSSRLSSSQLPRKT